MAIAAIYRIVLFLAFFGQAIIAPAQLSNYGSLKKYSYLIYGVVKHPIKGRDSTARGTAFFIRKNNRLFLVTAPHVLDGTMDANGNKFLGYSDTMFVRVGAGKLWSINIIEYKKHKEKPPLEEESQYQYHEFKKPFQTNDIINSIESFIQTKVSPIHKYLTWGFPGNMPFSETMESCFSTFKGNINEINSLNSELIVNSGSVGHGYSGAPIFQFIDNANIVFTGLFWGMRDTSMYFAPSQVILAGLPK